MLSFGTKNLSLRPKRFTATFAKCKVFCLKDGTPCRLVLVVIKSDLSLGAQLIYYVGLGIFTQRFADLERIDACLEGLFARKLVRAPSPDFGERSPDWAHGFRGLIGGRRRG
jgi:hypothetical protein